MFDSITFKNGIGPSSLIDIGALAESLLFYDRVAIIANTGTIKELLARIPPLMLLSLLRDKRVEIYYLADQTGISTSKGSKGRSLHNLVQLSSPDHTIEKVAPTAFKAAAGATNQVKIGARNFARLLRPIDHAGFDQNSILNALEDNITITASVHALIRTLAPEFSNIAEVRFKIERENNGFYIDTNIDFDQLNTLYHKSVPATHSSLSEAYILGLIQGVYETSYFAGMLNTEIAVHPIERVIQTKTIEAIIHRRTHSESQIEAFSDLTLTDGHAIREAVNSGRVPFSSVVKLLESADKFRHWLKNQPADVNLIKAYYQETIKDSWVEKLPAKSVRWGIFTSLGVAADTLGAGGLGTVAGIAISAVDSFLLDKLIQGWKPHQFIESDLAPLFDPTQSRKVRK